MLALLTLCGLLLTAPVANAEDPDCEGPYCCDRDPGAIVQRYLEAGVNAVFETIARAHQAAGKLKCSVYEMAFLCSNETFPPQISLTRTNPSNTHGHYSPCYEIFAPGVANPFGCKTQEVYQHVFFDNGYHKDGCVPVQNMILPSNPGG